MNRTIILSLVILCSLVSCAKDDANGRTYTYTAPVIPADTTTTPNNTDTTRSLLALGDSYTIGQSVPEADRFAVQAAKSLTADKFKFSAPEIIAQTGWTTGFLLKRLSDAAPQQPQYDIVTLLIGVNNQYQNRTQQEYTDEFLILLKKAIQYAGNNKKRVIVLSIPDYSVTPFASGSDKASIAREIDAFNVINKTIAMQQGVNYIDITPSSRLAANDQSLTANDGLHPSGLQYKLWSDLLVPAIKIALQ